MTVETLFDPGDNRQGNGRVWGRQFLLVLAVALLCSLLSFGHEVSAQEPDPEQNHFLFLPALGSGETTDPAPRQMQAGWPAGRLYTVRSGDTLLTVALEMGIDLEDMACLLSPDFHWSRPLVIGNTLSIPATPFACHEIQEDESVASLAARYSVSPALILEEAWNQISDNSLVPGQYLRIPFPLPNPVEGELVSVGPDSTVPAGLQPTATPHASVPANWPYGSGLFRWPTYGWLTQGYRIGHSAVDIAAPLGSPVTAADRGVVIRAGWSSVGYGKFVVIDHKIDYLTLYAHLSEILVEPGQVVAQGELIGRVGSTGNSTGPHLHFEIRDFGRRIDPLSLLSP